MARFFGDHFIGRHRGDRVQKWPKKKTVISSFPEETEAVTSVSSGEGIPDGLTADVFTWSELPDLLVADDLFAGLGEDGAEPQIRNAFDDDDDDDDDEDDEEEDFGDEDDGLDEDEDEDDEDDEEEDDDLDDDEEWEEVDDEDDEDEDEDEGEEDEEDDDWEDEDDDWEDEDEDEDDDD
jgi:hypothetical protein